MSLDTRDVSVTVTFAEEEARFLAGLMFAALDDLTEQQRAAAFRISDKFIEGARVTTDRLVATLGADAAEELAQRCMRDFPDIEEVELR